MAASLDRRIVLWILGVMVSVIVVFSMFAPANDDPDPSPTTYNSGSAGTKAAYLVLGKLGYGAERWELLPENLKDVDATKATLILAGSNFPAENAKDVKATIADFLSRGGRVLATGRGRGGFSSRLEDGTPPGRIYQGLCVTTPEGDKGALAGGGKGLAWGLCPLVCDGAEIPGVAALRRGCGRCELQAWRGWGVLGGVRRGR